MEIFKARKFGLRVFLDFWSRDLFWVLIFALIRSLFLETDQTLWYNMIRSVHLNYFLNA